MSILEQIYNSTLKFLTPLSLDETYKNVLNEAVKLVNGSNGRIFLKDGNNLKNVYNSSKKMPLFPIRKKGNVFKSFSQNKAFIANSKEVIENYPRLRGTKIRSIIYIPLSYKREAYGVMSIRSKKDLKFSENELNVLKLFGSLVDLAIRKSQLYEETKKAADTQDLFISLAAHELRTPLTTLIGYVQLLLSKSREKKNVDIKWVYEIAFEANRLKTLINEFLDINQIRTDKVEYDWKEIRLNEIIKRAIFNFNFVKPNRRIILNNKLNGKKDLIVGDSDRLTQVVTNLLENADKYSPSDKSIDVVITHEDPFFLLEVLDKGEGIPSEEISYVFKGFYKGKKSRHEGMGLGLFLVKNIIDRHHGEVRIKSEVDKGTSVIIKLPKVNL